jgi:hypothetical protein
MTVFSSASYSKSGHPAEWDIWLGLPRPRLVRMQKGQRFWVALIFGAMIAVSTILLGALLTEWESHPTKRTMTTDIWTAVPFIAMGIFLPLLMHISLKSDRRLLRSGEVTIGRVTGVRIGRKRSRIVTYEFLDCSGRLITTSCPDNTRSFSEGMAIPVFFNSENPESDQIALCGTPYEVAI